MDLINSWVSVWSLILLVKFWVELHGQIVVVKHSPTWLLVGTNKQGAGYFYTGCSSCSVHEPSVFKEAACTSQLAHATIQDNQTPERLFITPSSHRALVRRVVLSSVSLLAIDSMCDLGPLNLSLAEFLICKMGIRIPPYVTRVLEGRIIQWL